MTTRPDTEKLDRLIADVTRSGGAEMANAQPFVMRLTDALGLPQSTWRRDGVRFFGNPDTPSSGFKTSHDADE